MKRGRSSRGLKNQGGPNLGVEKPLRRSKRLRSSSVAKPAVVERKRSSKSLQKARSSRSKATTRPAYVYEPVDTDVGEIRILTLLPGLASSEIQISLEIDRLSEGEVPQFEALSYVWGSAEHSVEISVFTKGESTTARSLSVTQNLAVALLHLRGEKVPRRLWIDAICVDQRNLGERGRQVERMPEVYRSAERVVVWLGPERESSNLAMAAIRTLSAKVYYDQSTYVIKPFTEADENCASMDQNLQFDHLTMTAITKLFIRPWFERLWVQQEIRFAKDTSVIMCGAECILWPIFHNAMICMCLKPKESPKYSALHNRCNFLLNAFHQNMFDISLKLSMTRLGSCRCLDPRDKIYAVLSLINTKDRNDSFKPDYKKSTAEVYKDFVSMHLQHPHGLNIISMCEITEARNTMLPSWVPDWSEPSKTQFAIPYCYTSGRSASVYRNLANNTLGIVGKRSEIVSLVVGHSLGLNLSNTGDMEELVSTIRTLLPRQGVDMALPYPGGGTLLDAYCLVLSCNNVSEREAPPALCFPHLRAIRDLVRAIADGFFSASSLSYDEHRILSNIQGSITGRVLFVTAGGLIGLGPKMLQPQDIICVLLGVKVPLALRPATGGRYRIVGECFICGLMENQALLGPLPENIKLVWRTEEGRAHPAFHDLDTKTMSPDDPRLGHLPAGWRKLRWEKEHLVSYFEEEDGDLVGEGLHWPEQKTLYRQTDPRLDPEYLRKQGIELEEFQLV